MGHWIAIGDYSGLLLVVHWIAIGCTQWITIGCTLDCYWLYTVDCYWLYTGLLLVVHSGLLLVVHSGLLLVTQWITAKQLALSLNTSGSPDGLVTTKSSSSQTVCGLG